MKKFKNPFPQNKGLKAFIASKEVCRILQRAGFQAFFVGGGVRDHLLNRTPKDFDIATDCPIDKVIEMFPTTGADIRHKFFVHTFRDQIGEIIDIAMFRNDRNMNSRMSDLPEVGDIETDTKRRDFTMNAIYFDPISGKFIDLLGGIQDIKERVIRCTNDPAFLFDQDPVRVARGLRFSLQFNMRLDFDFNAFKYLISREHKQFPEIEERLMQEFRKIAKLPAIVVRGLTDVQLFNHFVQ